NRPRERSRGDRGEARDAGPRGWSGCRPAGAGLGRTGRYQPPGQHGRPGVARAGGVAAVVAADRACRRIELATLRRLAVTAALPAGSELPFDHFAAVRTAPGLD